MIVLYAMACDAAIARARSDSNMNHERETIELLDSMAASSLRKTHCAN